MADANELLDIGQAAEFLHVSETSLRRWTNSGKLACLRIGQKRERRFRRVDLLAFMENQPGENGASSGRDDTTTGSRARSPESDGRRTSHMCGLYSTDAGRVALAVPFLLDGLREGSVCFLVAGPRARDDILEHLTEKRELVPADIESGKLVLSNYHKSPREQLEYFADRLSEATRNGARSFRVFGEMWALYKKTSAATVTEYEYGYDQLISARFPLVTLCAYDARRFDGVGVLGALKGHPDTLGHQLQDALAYPLFRANFA